MKNKLPQQPNCLERYLVHYKRIKRIINKVKNTHSSCIKKYDEKPEKRSNARSFRQIYTHLTELAANYHGSTNDTNDNLNTYDNLICEIKTKQEF